MTIDIRKIRVGDNVAAINRNEVGVITTIDPEGFAIVKFIVAPNSDVREMYHVKYLEKMVHPISRG